MYEGTNKTALLSQELIADTLLSLLRENAFSEISISRICKQAGVSRQTFYTVFGTKENVMVYELSRHCRYTPEGKSGPDRTGLEAFSRSYAAYLTENRDLLALLVRNDMMECLYRTQRECFMNCDGFLRGVTGDERVFLVDFLADSLSVIARSYVLTGAAVSEEALAGIIRRLLGGDYFRD